MVIITILAIAFTACVVFCLGYFVGWTKCDIDHVQPAETAENFYRELYTQAKINEHNLNNQLYELKKGSNMTPPSYQLKNVNYIKSVIEEDQML